mmetsp:Transcript_10295/g.37946  ORF Transcript_10295/g.37946 Transcript_10295/m.37946 type:complete len:84 (-) Transcript_10295:794-1045(-)
MQGPDGRRQPQAQAQAPAAVSTTAVLGTILTLLVAYFAYDISQIRAGGTPAVHPTQGVPADVQSPYVDRLSLNGKIHISFCQS